MRTPPPPPTAPELPSLAAVLDEIPVPIFFKDAQGVYRGCNRAFEDYLGKRRDEIVGRTVEDIAPPELAAVYRQADDALFRNPGVQRYEARIRGTDGVDREVVFHKATFTDPHGRLAGLVGTYLDVGELKRVERALRASEERLQLVLDATDQVSWDLDVASGRMVVGPQVTRLLGRLPDEAGTLEAVLRFIHPDDVPKVRAALAAHVAGATPTIDLELREQHADGSWRWFRVIARTVERDAGGPRRIVGTSVEITRAKEMHERLLVQEKLSSIGTLAAGLAHEVNNPLAVVAANVEYAASALRELARESPRVGDVLAALEDARDGAVRAARIVQDLRTYSRPGELSERLDLREVAESAANLAAGELRARCVLVLDLAEAPPVVGDSVGLGQVVVNLLVNAGQALGSRHGNVWLATGTADDGRAFLEVRDDGCGIAPEVRARIFDPFFTTKPPGVGTGLGLYLCHRTVTSLGGEVRVDSAPGRGSTFRVLLPPAAAPDRVASWSAGAARRRARVLVVDDQPAVARAMARSLAAWHDVEIADGGRSALERLLAGEAFDVLVCDVRMPDVDGELVWERLHDVRPALSRRVVFVTGAPTSEVSALVRRAGARVLAKPFEPADLARAVDEALAA